MVKEGFDTTVNTLANSATGIFEKSKSSEQIQKEQCERDGGYWDPERRVCILPTKQRTELGQAETTEPQQEIQDKKVSVNKDGTVSLTFPSGEQTTLTKEEYKNYLAQQTASLSSKGAPAPTQAVSKALAQPTAQELQQQQLIEQSTAINEQQLAQEAQAAEVNYVRAFAQALPEMIPDLIQIAGGAAIALATGGTLAGVGLVGVATGIRGVYNDVMNEIESQKGEYSATQSQNLEEGKQVLNAIISARNAGATNAANAATAWNKQITTLYQSYYNLQLQQSQNKFVGEDLSEEIAEFETYFTGEYLTQLDEYALALRNPDPSRVIVSPAVKDRIIAELKSQTIK